MIQAVNMVFQEDTGKIWKFSIVLVILDPAVPLNMPVL